VIPTTFHYTTPATVAELTALLAEDPERSVVLSGGTWVVPGLNRGELTPRRVVDLRRAGLSSIERSGRDVIRVGATATYADLLASGLVDDELPLLGLMAREVTGGPQIHNQGTLGGSLCAARPGSDAAAAVVTLGGVAVVAGPGGTRRVPLREFLLDAFVTCLAPGEALIAVEFPVRPPARHGYYKLKRGGSSWPIATASVQVRLGADGLCEHAALTLGAVAAVPVPVPVEQILQGRRPEPGLLDEAARFAAGQVRAPWDDELASGRYRAAVSHVVARRALQRALSDTHEETLR
jgi:carbon-monoxide dehydrogenase medium subunit